MTNFRTAHQTLLDLAATQAALDDFGPENFREGYERLLDSLDDARLSDNGAIAARESIIRALISRLRAIDGFKKHDAAMKTPIIRPLIVTGIVRSGTTALHKLLSMDEQFQGTEHWITAAPQPRPARRDWPKNLDFQRASAQLDAMIEIAPEMLEDHGMSVDGVEESLNILAHTFCSNMYPSQFDIPEYDKWYRAEDDTFSYEYLADVLRIIGANEAEKTWLLKNPTDTFSLQQVINVFPDALVIQTHRDPLQSIPSIVNLLAGAKRIFQGENADLKRTFEREQEFWAEAMAQADLTKATLSDERFMDIRFDDFVQDQLGVVASIYDHFDLTLTNKTENAMGDWLKANPRKSKTMQRFTPEDYGCETAALLEEYTDYRTRYGFI